MKDVDTSHLQRALEVELESTDSNKVREHVDLPKWVKPIKCKLVYKWQRGVDGRVQTFKAQLVAKGYT